MEFELVRLEEQRAHYLLAARTSMTRDVTLRRLLSVERLTDQIESLQEALAAFDEHTMPLEVSDSTRIRLGLGPVTPPAF